MSDNRVWTPGSPAVTAFDQSQEAAYNSQRAAYSDMRRHAERQNQFVYKDPGVEKFKLYQPASNELDGMSLEQLRQHEGKKKEELKRSTSRAKWIMGAFAAYVVAAIWYLI